MKNVLFVMICLAIWKGTLCQLLERRSKISRGLRRHRQQREKKTSFVWRFNFSFTVEKNIQNTNCCFGIIDAEDFSLIVSKKFHVPRQWTLYFLEANKVVNNRQTFLTLSFVFVVFWCSWFAFFMFCKIFLFWKQKKEKIYICC